MWKFLLFGEVLNFSTTNKHHSSCLQSYKQKIKQNFRLVMYICIVFSDNIPNVEQFIEMVAENNDFEELFVKHTQTSDIQSSPLW